MKFPLLSFILFTFILSGCDHNDKKSLHLNIVGLEYKTFDPSPSFMATWSDATLNPLGTVGSHFCGLADGGDAYYGGDSNGTPAYWKNGELVTLNGVGYVSAIFAFNDDVYCAGFIETEINQHTPVYWKNKEMKTITTKTGDLPNLLIAIFVSGTDVYIAGNYGSHTGSYWKNGEEIGLPGDDIYVIDIAVSGNDVHLIGVDNTDAWHIKNGVRTALSHPTKTGSIWPTSIFVDQSDVYITGGDFVDNGEVAVYWKNGSPVLLDGYEASVIKKSGEDIYVAGLKLNKAGTAVVPAYWINSVSTEMQFSTSSPVPEYKVFDLDFTTN